MTKLLQLEDWEIDVICIALSIANMHDFDITLDHINDQLGEEI